LLIYSCTISDIIEEFTGAETVIMGDVTYGACCIDDLSAKALDCDFLVHYGHSCLVPISVTGKFVQVLYVFVDVSIDVDHLVECIRSNICPDSKFAILGTIQFSSAIHAASSTISQTHPNVVIPQASPLSRGEVLGCTSPSLAGLDSFVFIADGRFHIESAMIANPSVSAFLYNPYNKVISRESYDVDRMRTNRFRAIEKAKAATNFGIILGTLGRQGNPSIMNHIEQLLKNSGKKYFVLLLSEVYPHKLALFKDIDCWIQVACPRLSIDWGHYFEKPLLSSYEAEVAFGEAEWSQLYPMDYYAKGSGPWTNYNQPNSSN